MSVPTHSRLVTTEDPLARVLYCPSEMGVLNLLLPLPSPALTLKTYSHDQPAELRPAWDELLASYLLQALSLHGNGVVAQLRG
jgi:hypothetical protein